MSLLAVLAGGCASAGPEKALVIRRTEQFDREVLQSGKPALVLFSKQGCAPCAPLYGTMDRLACEYKARAVVAKFMALTFFFHAPAPELNARYNICWVPTVILFANGQPRRRWLCEYSIDTYRQALNEVLPPPSP
ncbi:MAG TPA: thioredoxin domain-containing protein [Phycisphaerae bacterium]|nr:thioredoxin domain-containing protein [Phycisphaerae bacterium]